MRDLTFDADVALWGHRGRRREPILKIAMAVPPVDCESAGEWLEVACEQGGADGAGIGGAAFAVLLINAQTGISDSVSDDDSDSMEMP